MPRSPRSKLVPVAPERFLLQLTIGQRTQAKLQYARELLGHRLPTRDLAEVLDRALDALIARLERQKFAATARPRRGGRPSRTPRHIPAEVKREVWARDQGQCTFVSESGRRCSARSDLEFDHIEPIARGGPSRAENLRLRCRGHNQYAAERVFGAEFMRWKRAAAGESVEARRREKEERALEARREREARAKSDVAPWLRQLGFRADEVRRAEARCAAIPEASLEERLRLALSCLAPPHRHVAPSLGTST